MSAWKTDDKTWMKERRANWKNINYSIERVGHWHERTQKRGLKNFYLTGDTGEPNYPIERFHGAALLEMWLNADTSLDNFFRIKAKYEALDKNDVNYQGRIIDARNIFNSYERENTYTNKQFKGVSFFNGLEIKFFEIFSFKRLAEEVDAYGGSFEKRAKWYYLIYGAFTNFMRQPYNPYDISPYQVPIWHDSIPIGYIERPEFYAFVRQVDEVIKTPEPYHEKQVQLAKELIEVLNDQTLPEPFKKRIHQVRTLKKRKGLVFAEYKNELDAYKLDAYFSISFRHKLDKSADYYNQDLYNLAKLLEFSKSYKIKNSSICQFFEWLEPTESLQGIATIAQYFNLKTSYSVVKTESDRENYEFYRLDEGVFKPYYQLTIDDQVTEADIEAALDEQLADLEKKDFFKRSFKKFRQGEPLE